MINKELDESAKITGEWNLLSLFQNTQSKTISQIERWNFWKN